MSDSSNEFRPFQHSDRQALEDITRDTWDYDQLGSSKTARLVAKADLAGSLASQTFTCVALSGNQPIGIIMGKNRKTDRNNFRYTAREKMARLSMGLSKESRKLLPAFKDIEKVHAVLFEKTAAQFDGELVFFVVHKDWQGKGVGKTLYESFLDYLAAEELKSYFLFTDTSCNYKFYERRGLDRLAEETLGVPKLKKERQFFLYGTD